MAHVGTIGERMDIFVKCVRVREYYERFGGKKVDMFDHILVDRFDNRFVYDGSKELKVGHFYGMKITVKEHLEETMLESATTVIARPIITLHKEVVDGREIVHNT